MVGEGGKDAAGDPEQKGVDVQKPRDQHQGEEAGHDQVLDRVDAQDLQGVELLADLSGPQIGGDRGPRHPGDHDRGHEGGELADRGQDEEAPEPVKGPEQGGEVGRLKPRGAEAEGDGRDQHRKPAELEGEDELGDELAAVGVGGPDGGGDRLAGEDHHVPHLLEQRLGGQERPIGNGSDHLLLRPHAAWAAKEMYSMRLFAATPNHWFGVIRAAGRWYVPPRLGGERHNRRKAPTPGRESEDCHRDSRACPGLGRVRLRRWGAPGRLRAIGRLPGRGDEGEVPRAASSWSRPANVELEIENVGDQTIPNLAVTIYTTRASAATSEPKPERPFGIRLDEPGLADPTRPVWILEEGYPKLITPGITVKRSPRPRRPARPPLRPTPSSSGRCAPGRARTSSGG